MYQLAVLLQFGIFGVSHGLKVVRMMNRFAFFLFSFFYIMTIAYRAFAYRGVR